MTELIDLDNNNDKMINYFNLDNKLLLKKNLINLIKKVAQKHQFQKKIKN